MWEISTGKEKKLKKRKILSSAGPRFIKRWIINVTLWRSSAQRVPFPAPVELLPLCFSACLTSPGKFRDIAGTLQGHPPHPVHVLCVWLHFPLGFAPWGWKKSAPCVGLHGFYRGGVTERCLKRFHFINIHFLLLLLFQRFSLIIFVILLILL